VKSFLKKAGVALLVLLIPVAGLKLLQNVCWVTDLGTPSLDSWDPTERMEAAWWAAKKYGGKP
jgi:hypothetical protein